MFGYALALLPARRERPRHCTAKMYDTMARWADETSGHGQVELRSFSALIPSTQILHVRINAERLRVGNHDRRTTSVRDSQRRKR
jgi:hypothetical protein